MCIACPDFVTQCGEGDCLGPEVLPDGRRNLYSRSRKFRLDDDLCEHLQAKHGVRTARELDALALSEDDA